MNSLNPPHHPTRETWIMTPFLQIWKLSHREVDILPSITLLRNNNTSLSIYGTFYIFWPIYFLLSYNFFPFLDFWSSCIMINTKLNSQTLLFYNLKVSIKRATHSSKIFENLGDCLQSEGGLQTIQLETSELCNLGNIGIRSQFLP